MEGKWTWSEGSACTADQVNERMGYLQPYLRLHCASLSLAQTLHLLSYIPCDPGAKAGTTFHILPCLLPNFIALDPNCH